MSSTSHDLNCRWVLAHLLDRRKKVTENGKLFISQLFRRTLLWWLWRGRDFNFANDIRCSMLIVSRDLIYHSPHSAVNQPSSFFACDGATTSAIWYWDNFLIPSKLCSSAMTTRPTIRRQSLINLINLFNTFKNRRWIPATITGACYFRFTLRLQILYAYCHPIFRFPDDAFSV